MRFLHAAPEKAAAARSIPFNSGNRRGNDLEKAFHRGRRDLIDRLLERAAQQWKDHVEC